MRNYVENCEFFIIGTFFVNVSNLVQSRYLSRVRCGINHDGGCYSRGRTGVSQQTSPPINTSVHAELN